LLLLQVPEDLTADSLQALHLPLAFVHLPFQGLNTQGQLGRERKRKGVRGEQRRSQVRTMGAGEHKGRRQTGWGLKGSG